MVRDDRADQLVELSRDDAIQLVERDVDTVIREPILRKVVGPDFLGAVPRLHLAAAFVSDRVVLALPFLIEQPAA